MSIFDELQTSLHEAVEIKQGKKQASRIKRHEVAARLECRHWRKKNTARKGVKYGSVIERMVGPVGLEPTTKGL